LAFPPDFWGLYRFEIKTKNDLLFGETSARQVRTGVWRVDQWGQPVKGQFDIFLLKRSARSRAAVHAKKACWIPACAGMTIPADDLVKSTVLVPAKAGTQP
jgi:hypothetical protein